MADLNTPPSPPKSFPPSSSIKKDDHQLVQEKVEKLNESQSELLGRLQGLRTDLQGWKSTIDTQLKTYKDELSELKTRLHSELEQLTTDFQGLKTTLQKQQEDVTTSLKTFGLQDEPDTPTESEIKDTENAQAPLSDSIGERKTADEPSTYAEGGS